MNYASTEHDFTYSNAATESLSEAVIEAVAEAEDVDETDLTPLFEVCDPESLDSLFQQSSSHGLPTTGEVRFEYHGYTVCVQSDGWVRLLEK